MSKARMRWLMFGIVSVLIMSVFMIYRIILDRTVNELNLDTYEKTLMTRAQVDRFYNMIDESKRRTIVWVYDPTDSENITALTELKGRRRTSLKFGLELFVSNTEGGDLARIEKLLSEFDTLLARQGATPNLSRQAKIDHEEPSFLSGARASLRSDIVERADSLMAKVDVLAEDLKDESERLADEASARRYRGSFVLSVLAFLMFLAGLIGMVILMTAPGWKNKPAP